MKIYSFDEFEKEVIFEGQLNEGLFGIGSPSKPEVILSIDYIREHTPEEIGEVFFDMTTYYMDKAKYDVDQAISTMNEFFADAWTELKNSAEDAKKFIEGIVTSVKSAISNKYKNVAKYASALPNNIVCGICYLVKLGVSGFDSAKTALTNLCNDIADFMKKTYDEIAEKLAAAGEKVSDVISQFKDKISIFAKVSAAIGLVVAKKIEGIGNKIGEWMSSMLKAAKSNALLAVMVVKTWLSSKAEEVADFVKTTASDIADSISTAWDGLKRDVKKTCEKITDTLSDWMSSIKLAAANIAKKIGEVAKAAGEKLISVKDAAASTVVKKGVKALNKKNYSLDDVIDMVTTAYNENIYVMKDGSMMLNETRFYKDLGLYYMID